MTHKVALKALKKENLATPPVWMMRQAGRYLPEYRALRKEESHFLSFCLNAQKASEVTLQPLKRFDFDVAILFADILTIPHALKRKVEFKKGEGPVLELIQSSDEIKHMQDHVSNIPQTLSPVFETIKQTIPHLNNKTALFGFCGGPWTVASYMMDNHPSKDTLSFRKLAYNNPSHFKELLNVIVESSVLYLSEQIKAGADAIQIFDSWAGSVPHDLFDIAIKKPLFAICQKIKALHPHTPIILFPRGLQTKQYQKLVDESEGVFEGLSLDFQTDLAWACKNLQNKVCLQGNLDPAILLTTPKEVVKQTTKMLQIATEKPGYICNLGHGITPTTPIENVQAFVDTVKNWKK